MTYSRSGRPPVYPLLTRDPVSGGEFLVTRLECPTSGVVLEGSFSLGWMGRLTPEQLEFVGLLVQGRGNLQKVAADLSVSYNTARNRMDEIVMALGGVPETGTLERERRVDRKAILDRLAAGEISPEEATHLLKEQ